MNRYVVTKMMIVVMLLFGASHSIEASALALAGKVAGEAAQSAVSSLTSRLSLTAATEFVQGLIAAGVTNVNDFATAFLKSIDNLAASAGKAFDPSMVIKYGDNLIGSLKSVKNIGGDVGLFGADDITKLTTGKVDDVTATLKKITWDGPIDKMPAGYISPENAAKLTSSARNSSAALEGMFAQADNVAADVGTVGGKNLDVAAAADNAVGAADTVSADAAGKLKTAVANDAAAKAQQKGLGEADNILGKEIAQKGDDAIAKGGAQLDNAVDDISEGVATKVEGAATKTTQEATQEVTEAATSHSAKLKKALGISPDTAATDALNDIAKYKKMLDDPNIIGMDRIGVERELAAAQKQLVKAQRNPAMKIVKGIQKLTKDYGIYVVGALAGATLMLAPGLIQSAYIAKQNKNAMLQTYLPPMKFGNIVMQLPDSVINVYNPMMSQFVYYGIPVNNPGDKLSAQAQAAYPGISGPTAKNKISQNLQNDMGEVFSLGSAKKVSIPRYNLDAHALANLPIYVMYSDSIFIPWSSAGIPDATFTQMMVNLNTGAILYADGTSQGSKPVTLIGPKNESGMHTIQSFMTFKLGALNSTGSQAQFTEFQQTFSSVKASKVSGPIASQFDCSCLVTTNNGILSADATKACAAGNSCLLGRTLDQIAAGVVLNSAGHVLTPDQNLDAEIAKGALGQVIPIQGLGNKFNDVLQLFPGAQQNSLANTGALTVSLGADMSNASSIKVQGADPDNYVAKGVYVYQCKNTPLAKILKNQAGGSAAYANQITDYIVFLDSDLNQVPLMAPVADPKNYNFLSMGLNPAIKYFSTIIGQLDANGGFTFLPQLDIQSPAALVAKGLPSTFSPLYALQATNGSLAINYNQNLPTVVGAIVQALLQNPKLGQQFKTMQSAMTSLLASGPFGKYALNPISQDMQPSIGGISLPMYTGFNSYPVSQDQANADCTDILIPISAQGKTVTLPSNNVAQYYGLVTDLTYTVSPDGSITVAQTGFANSAFDPATWNIDSTKAAQYYWINKLTSMGTSADPSFVMPPSLVNAVQQARAAWIAWVQATATSGLTTSEFTGVSMPGGTNVLTSASQQALSNGLYLYTCSPCPSSVQDYFVLTNSSAPQATDGKLGTLSATQATTSTNMLSVISGILYDASGAPVKNNAGATYSVDATTLLKTLGNAFPQALANDLKIKLNISSGTTAATAMAMVYPFSFGDLQLGQYQVDIDKNVYLYFDASGAGASANFQPADYFVTVDSYVSPSSMGLALDTTTKYVVSLVSGQVYDPSGVVDAVTPNTLTSIISTLSGQWRSGVASQIAVLTAKKVAADKATDQQTAAMANDVPLNTGGITWPQATVVQMITSLAAQDYLAAPYSMLKQDPSTGLYALVSPANADMTQFIYTFFNVPNSIQNAQGNPIQIAASYDAQGNLIRVMDGFEYISILHQYGIGIDSAGKQYLGASNSLPMLQLDPADVALKPGMSGKSMLLSSDPNFPSHDIVSPVSYNNKQFYFYYNTGTQAYYAMQVNGSDISYIDMAGGCVYNQDGSPRFQLNPVAMQSNQDATDLFLPYLTADGFIQCVMKNLDNNNAYSDFYNSTNDFQPFVTDAQANASSGLNLLYSLDAAASSVNVAQMPFPQDLTAMPDLSATNQYNVYFDGSTTPLSYTVVPNYQWQSLQLLPISMTTRALLNPMPADQYTSASLIMNGNAMFAIVFGGQFYNNAQSAGQNSYAMTSGTNQIVVSMKVDAQTSSQYIEVVAGSVTYNYQCSFMTLIDSQLTELRRNAWQLEVVADVTGNVALEPYLSVDSSGNLQLSPVSINSVVNVPTDATAKSALSTGLGNIQFDAGTGKYITSINASTYAYFTQQGFVDLENGVLFDATGLLVGYTLQYADLMALLSSLSVAVVRDSTGKASLTYRAPTNLASINTALSTLSSSYVPSSPVANSTSSTTMLPASTPTPTYTPSLSSSSSSYVPTASTSSSNNSSYMPTTSTSSSDDSSYMSTASSSSSDDSSYVSPPTATTSSTSQAAAPTSSTSSAAQPSAASVNSGVSSNSAIADLQMKNQKLKADISARQKSLAGEKIAHRREVIQKAIQVANDQIKANNQQIASLQASGSARSSLLGRFTSNLKQKHAKPCAKAKKAMKGITL